MVYTKDPVILERIKELEKDNKKMVVFADDYDIQYIDRDNAKKTFSSDGSMPDYISGILQGIM